MFRLLGRYVMLIYSSSRSRLGDGLDDLRIWMGKHACWVALSVEYTMLILQSIPFRFHFSVLTAQDVFLGPTW
jgi:hypothetical protein